ncbi:hypothetical protein CPJCM30710_13730 [Clostridium polyendosporum]|uniref:Glycosyltransferase subfamily 4-like N-terminal domain-containing protein n=1 Tax=Clostridium polyendosporum TaxID=69208 RepID=A0A919RYA3_9CLOT|nr:glycosyltransferase [Clostridium polyendosporum]GIM28707.1 hypothetical protein CPJCM30710_13730 [Clostridium polyendosporum]
MKILFIACYSPMINNSASIETLMYLNNLCKIKGNEIHLLTVDFPKDSIYYDEEVFKLLDKRVKVYAISGGKIFNKIMPKRYNGYKDSGSRSGLKTSILRGIKNKFIFPDMYTNWVREASKVGIELMKKERIDVIFSMHEPPSSHLCALKIKKQFKKIPWITYWSDPWLKDSTRENSWILRRKIEAYLENKIINNADKFIYVTEENRQDYIKTYNIQKEKTFFITRGYNRKIYDEILSYNKPSLIFDNKINIIYAGEIFIKLRDIYPFIEAVKELEQEENAFAENFNILFFGNIDDENAKTSLEALNTVTVKSRIPYREALSYMLNSQVLLLFGNKNSKQIPAKIYDYFGTNSLIYTILGDEKDPLISLVKDKHKCIMTNNKKKEIKNTLLNIGKIYEDKNFKVPPIEEYEWSNISHKLNNILKG